MRILLLSLLLAVSTAFAIETEPPNIVLVMADDQGWGDMAYNGHSRLKTPNFDALAREGIRFDNFHAAAPVCSPTRGSVLTGRTPNRFGCFSWGYPLRPQEITLPEILRASGYISGHYGKWHLGGVQKASPVSPGASGFDHWTSAPNFFDLDPVLSDEGVARQFKGDSSDVTADLAIQFIRERSSQKQRFLAVVWFGSPHSPHQALAEDRAAYSDLPEKEQNFLGEITAMDRAFGRIRQELKNLNADENTVLWFCSDNGALPKVGSTGGRRGNKGQVYEGGLLVPALLEWPALFKEPKVIQEPCTTADILPTVLAMTRTEVEKLPLLDGVNLMPLLEGTEKQRNKPIGFWDAKHKGKKTPSAEWMNDLLAAQAKGDEPVDPERLFSDAGEISETVPLNKFPGHAAWLDGTWKLHRIEDKTGHVEWELYDLAADPDESRVLYAEQPERVPQMQGALEDWLESVARSLNGEDYK